MRSIPPPWMSKCGASDLPAIAEHSMCHPGRPCPHGLSQPRPSGSLAFHSAKSSGSRFTSPTSTRAPASRSSMLRCESLPYPGKAADREVDVVPLRRLGDVGGALGDELLDERHDVADGLADARLAVGPHRTRWPACSPALSSAIRPENASGASPRSWRARGSCRPRRSRCARTCTRSRGPGGSGRARRTSMKCARAPRARGRTSSARRRRASPCPGSRGSRGSSRWVIVL